MGDLSPRERDVLAGIARGRTDKEIGAELGVSFHAVKVYGRTLRAKIGTKNRVETALWAIRNQGGGNA